MIRIRYKDKKIYDKIRNINRWIDVGVRNGILPKRANNQQHVDNYIKWVDVLNKRNIIIEESSKPKFYQLTKKRNKMRKLIFEIKKGNEVSHMEFITDRTPGWTIQQYLRNRSDIVMTLISNNTTDEKDYSTREITLNNNEK